MKFVRTPDDRFADLPHWPYEPQYFDNLPGFEGLRMHYVAVGDQGRPTLLCLHGEPTWSYLYRKMIPVFLEAGYRVVAPDFFGFGRSDKPVEDAEYTWDFHRRGLLAFIETAGLASFGLVCHNWGGLLGLTLPLDLPNAIDRLLVMNTSLGVGVEPSPAFAAWKAFVGCPEPMKLDDAGHFVQEAGEPVARAEIESWTR